MISKGAWFLGLCVVATACSSEGEEGGTQSACKLVEQKDYTATLSIVEGGGPAKTAYKVDAAQVPPGGKKDYAFEISNSAALLTAKPLKIDKITLVETDGDGKTVATPHFQCLGPGDVPCATAKWVEVIPDGFDKACAAKDAALAQTLKIRYVRPAQAEKRKLKVEIQTSGDASLKGQPYVLSFSAELGTPKLSCTFSIPEEDFGKQPIGATFTQDYACSNLGTAEVELQQVTLAGALPVSLSFGGVKVSKDTPFSGSPKVTIAPGTSLPLTVAVDKLPTDGKLTATLQMVSNDPATPTLQTQFVVNGTGPCLKVEPNSLDFATVAVGAQNKLEVKLVSCGSEEVAIKAIELAPTSAAGFGLHFDGKCFANAAAPTEQAPALVAINDFCPLTVSCSPPELGAQMQGQVVVHSNAGAPRTVTLACKGATEVDCATACMVVKFDGKEASEVIPQSKLLLDASCSKPSGNKTIAKYKWSVQQPNGSFSTFVPSATSKTPAFTPNVAGKYVFKLEVEDSAGTPGCTAITKEVTVVPDEKLHVELTWDTAADKDKTDEAPKPAKACKAVADCPAGMLCTKGYCAAGSDMDLHLAHPDAVKVQGQKDGNGDGKPDPWFAPCLDCSLLNPLPLWGDLGDPDDDPSLDLDDRDGWGPENVNMLTPELGKLYYVGVHYINDYGFGKSVPKVRVYVDKTLALEKAGPEMAQGELWCATRVSYSPNQVQDCEGAPLSKGYPFPSNPDLLKKCP